jgi:hypothetical protein
MHMEVLDQIQFHHLIMEQILAEVDIQQQA